MGYLAHTLITANATTDSGYHLYVCDCTTNNITLSLNHLDSYEGTVIYVKRIDTNAGNTLTINSTSGATIDNLASIVLGILGTITDPNRVMLTRIGSNWFITNSVR